MMKLTSLLKTNFKLILGLGVLSLIVVLFLLNNLYSFNEYNTRNFNKYVIKGYDTVAYFTEGQPVKGSKEFSYEWKNVRWLFSSQEHLDLFKANPDKYAPQYGGYCAWAIAAKGKLYGIDPNIWKIVDDKLYLNYNEKIGDKWNQDIPNFINKGDEIWQQLITDNKK